MPADLHWQGSEVACTTALEPKSLSISRPASLERRQGSEMASTTTLEAKSPEISSPARLESQGAEGATNIRKTAKI